MGASVLVIYLSAIYGTYVPDWHFTVQSNNGTVQLTVSPRFLFSLFFSKKKIMNFYVDIIAIIFGA